MKVSADKYPNRMKYHWNDFTDKFCETLKGFQIEEVNDPNQLDEQIVKKIDKMLPLRDNFIALLELMCMTKTMEVDQVVGFFDKIYFPTEHKGMVCSSQEERCTFKIVMFQ